jgi:hypothetical protein
MTDSKNIICWYCNWDKPIDSSFWETHPTLANGEWYCEKESKNRVEAMTTVIVNRYKAKVRSTLGNRKRHRQ